MQEYLIETPLTSEELFSQLGGSIGSKKAYPIHYCHPKLGTVDIEVFAHAMFPVDDMPQCLARDVHSGRTVRIHIENNCPVITLEE